MWASTALPVTLVTQEAGGAIVPPAGSRAITGALAYEVILKTSHQRLVVSLWRNRRAAWAARARWLIWFFTADGSSAMVHACSGK